MICKSKHLFSDNQYKLYLTPKAIVIGKSELNLKYTIPLKLTNAVKWIFTENHLFKGFQFQWKRGWKTMLVENDQCLILRENIDSLINYKNLTHMFNIIQTIRENHSSKVFLTLCCIDKQKYILQIFNNVTSYSEKVSQHQHQEFKQLKSFIELEHPFITRYKEYFVEEDNLYLVTYYFGGKTLKERINSQYRMELNEMIFIMKALLNLLVKIHQLGCFCKTFSTESIYLQNNGEIIFLDLGNFINFEEAIRTKSASKEKESFDLKQLDNWAEIEKFQMQQHDVLLCGTLLHQMLTFKTRQKTMIIDKTNQLSSHKTIIITRSTKDYLNQLLKKMIEPDPKLRITALHALYFLEDMEFDDQSFEDFPDCSEDQHIENVKYFQTTAFIQQ